jgi:hypothetical protein
MCLKAYSSTIGVRLPVFHAFRFTKFHMAHHLEYHHEYQSRHDWRASLYQRSPLLVQVFF